MSPTPRFVRIDTPFWIELDGMRQMQPAVGLAADPNFVLDPDAGWDQHIPIVYKPAPAPGVPFVAAIASGSILAVDGYHAGTVSVAFPAPYTGGLDVPLDAPTVTVVEGPASCEIVELDWDAARRMFPGQFDYLIER